MQKIIGIISILILIAGSAVAADYWHFGMGLRGTAVLPGDEYSNALGVGVVASFGDPDSRFTTQMEIDSWKVTYSKDLPGDGYGALEHEYSGFGAGFFEKYRLYGFGSKISGYLIGGLGGYFLELKREEPIELVGLQMRSQYLHPRAMTAGGTGIDTRISQNITTFVEGRYVYIISGGEEDKPLIQGYLGLKYLF